MNGLDWLVLAGFLLFIVVYGIWKSRGSKNVTGYLLTDHSTRWPTIVLSIMATQASAITFLSTPGQAFVDGMRFLQFYLGLPIAMVILSVTAVPIFQRLQVFTAYEYLESRFDLKNRLLASLLFLIQRGLAAGLTIFAPALILSVILGWELHLTIILTGALVVIYTTAGGTKAVNKTHILQMLIIFFGITTAFVMIFRLLPSDVSPLDAVYVAGKLGKLNAIDFKFDLNNRYSFWSGIIGGTFLMLSYFGTDQSQVQRYLAGKSVAESRLGLLANGMVKVPMQFFILFTGAMLFVFYQFQPPPISFNPTALQFARTSPLQADFARLEAEYTDLHEQKSQAIRSLLQAKDRRDAAQIDGALQDLRASQQQSAALRSQGLAKIRQADPSFESNDTNYIFLSFVRQFLPVGIVGLVLAAILSASMSSTAAELNALAATTVIDFYRRLVKRNASERHYLVIARFATIFWGLYAIGFALFAERLGSLIEAVNILGSLFYGTILGIFLVAFYLKSVSGRATFFAAISAELVVLACFWLTDIPYLWYNVIGCGVLIGIALLWTRFFSARTNRC